MTSGLFTSEQREALLANGERSAAGDEIDPVPVVKLFLPGSGATWLLTEIMPHEPDIAFGLCDLGMGCPELGYVSLGELASVRSKLHLAVERDIAFKGDRPLSAYAAEAHRAGRIVA